MPDSAVVLIAEDDPSIARVVAMLVEDAGGTPLVASDGREALILARAITPMLVITDLMMPYLDGAALVRALREMMASRGVELPPVILMTAQNPQQAEQVDADVVLRKPFDLVELDMLLERFLG